jgi:hypothetical protein
MIFHPGIIALLVGSTLVAMMLCYSAYEGAIILRKWDIDSGSEEQLGMERKTYLISTLMAYGMGFQLLSLFLFIYTVDSLSHLFIGAMCAAGSLKANVYGYPTILLKLINFVLSGLWLIINYTDNRGFDYPLIKVKYVFLLCLTPLLLTETFLQGAYLLSLAPDLITSCCSVIFTSGSKNIVSQLVALPLRLSQVVFAAGAVTVFVLGMSFLRRRKGAVLFSLAVLMFFPASLAAVVSFVSIYIYELPTHHCPFCILHSEYGYVGYPLYLTLLIGTITGLGVGVIAPFGRVKSLAGILPPLQQRLARLSLLCLTLFLFIVAGGIWLSHLDMSAY